MSKYIFLFGDIHGHHYAPDVWLNIMDERFNKEFSKGLDLAVQVGDWGWYQDDTEMWDGYKTNVSGFSEFKSEVEGFKKLFIPGNHENWNIIGVRDSFRSKLSDTPYGSWQYAPRGYYSNGVLYVGGAFSVDRIPHFFYPGMRARPHGSKHPYGWWAAEEMTTKEEAEVWEIFERHKNDIQLVVTHECPKEILMNVCRDFAYTNMPKNVTADFLNKILQSLPNPTETKWVFGHHHRGTRYISNSGVKFYGLDMFRGFNDHRLNDWYIDLEIDA